MRPEREPLWLHPLTMLSLVCAAAVLLFVCVTEREFATSFGAPKQDLGRVLGVVSLGYASLTLGLLMAYDRGLRFIERRRQAEGDRDLVAFIGYCSLAASLAAYAIYFALAKVGVADILAGLSAEPGASYDLRRRFSTVPGITSFMSVAPLWFAYLAYRWVVTGLRPKPAMIAVSLLLAGCVVLRSVVGFERRAIIELVLPAVVVLVMLRPWARMRLILPMLGVLGVWTLFVVTEIFRSWANEGLASGQSLPIWMLARLGGYYATALNNGVLAIEQALTGSGSITFAGIYRLPVFGDLFGSAGLQADFVLQFKGMLKALANPDFNNPGGLVGAFIDFGWVGGALVLVALGTAFGVIHSAAARGHGVALLAYGFVVLSLLEITRVMVFLSPQGVIILFWLGGLWLVHWRLTRRRREEGRAW